MARLAERGPPNARRVPQNGLLSAGSIVGWFVLSGLGDDGPKCREEAAEAGGMNLNMSLIYYKRKTNRNKRKHSKKGWLNPKSKTNPKTNRGDPERQDTGTGKEQARNRQGHMQGNTQTNQPRLNSKQGLNIHRTNHRRETGEQRDTGEAHQTTGSKSRQDTQGGTDFKIKQELDTEGNRETTRKPDKTVTDHDSV